MHRILVVDDEPLTLYSLSMLLQGAGVEVTTVTNGSDAIKANQHCFYDLCLLDLCLPDMDGMDVMMEIRKLSQKSKIIVMSSSCVSDSVKELIDKNAYFFIPKPFELAYLKAILRRAMKEEDTACGQSDDRVKTFANEQRRLERTPFSRKISYTINSLDKLDFPQLEAQVVDISEVGMGIVTAYPVKTGCVIRFDMMQDVVDYKAGVVSNTCVVNDGMFRAGIEFV